MSNNLFLTDIKNLVVTEVNGYGRPRFVLQQKRLPKRSAASMYVASIEICKIDFHSRTELVIRRPKSVAPRSEISVGIEDGCIMTESNHAFIYDADFKKALRLLGQHEPTTSMDGRPAAPPIEKALHTVLEQVERFVCG